MNAAGRSAWDAQKSSANTNDLRGKILRIKPHDDGSYTCPAGNLFAAQAVHITDKAITGDPQTGKNRPEIYVMGCRNPFRISYDDRRKLLFWGEVGPDAGEPDTTCGPQGHDEVNRAKAAGFFGWPYFVGDNKPYRDRQFASKTSGPYYDANHPINDSPNNTGMQGICRPLNPPLSGILMATRRNFPSPAMVVETPWPALRTIATNIPKQRACPIITMASSSPTTGCAAG